MYAERYCPLMGGKPCMGKQCGCALAWSDTIKTYWHCGLAHDGDLYAVNVIGIDDKEDE